MHIVIEVIAVWFLLNAFVFVSLMPVRKGPSA